MIRRFIAAKEGDVLRIDGEPHVVEHPSLDGSIRFMVLRDRSTRRLSFSQLRELADESRIVTEAEWQSLGSDVHTLLSTSWDLIPADAIAKAKWRMVVHEELDAYGPRERRKRVNIEKAIAAARANGTDPRWKDSIQQIREFDTRWIVSGRNPKSLCDLDYLKGNRRENDEAAWIDVEANRIIDELLACGTPRADIQKEVEDRLLLYVKAHPDLPLRPNIDLSLRVIGKHRAYDLIDQRDFQTQNLNVLGRKETRRRAAGVSNGPRGEYALHEVEVDHTLLDLLVRFEGKERRAWLTVLIDRYSRLIIGYYLTLEPPSWFSVAMALRMAVLPKQALLQSLNYNFFYTWSCFGSPDYIFADRGPEFRSATYSEICRLLRIIPMDLPKASGWLKGKVERFLGTNGRGLLKNKPGYVGGNVTQRLEDFADASKMEFAALDRAIVIWIVESYNPHVDEKTGRSPLKRFEQSISDGNLKFPPSDDLIGSILTPAKTALLTERGIALDGLRYKSDALLRMWNDAGGNVQVLVHVDPQNADTILVTHGSARERLKLPEKWVDGSLQGEHAGLGLSHRLLRERIKAERPKETPEEVEKRARARVQANNELRKTFGVKKIHKLGEPPPRKVTTHINRPHFDPDASAAPFAGYNPDRPIPLVPYDSTGPWGGPTISEEFFRGSLGNGASKQIEHSSTVTHAQEASDQIRPSSDIDDAPAVETDKSPADSGNRDDEDDGKYEVIHF